MDEIANRNGIQLFQNIPNPTDGTTMIRFELLQSRNVTVELRDLQGRLIQAVERGQLPAGNAPDVELNVSRSPRRHLHVHVGCRRHAFDQEDDGEINEFDLRVKGRSLDRPFLLIFFLRFFLDVPSHHVLKATLARSFAKWTARSEGRKAIAGLARQEACFNALIAKGAQHGIWSRPRLCTRGCRWKPFKLLFLCGITRV